MNPKVLSLSQLKTSVEQKAYAYGVSPVVSMLLSEHVVNILKHQPYVRRNETQKLVPGIDQSSELAL